MPTIELRRLAQSRVLLVLLACLMAGVGTPTLAAPVPNASALASPVPPPVPSPAPIASPIPLPSVAPLSDAALHDPSLALAASRNVVGGALSNAAGVYVSGMAQVGAQSLPFTSVVDLRTGYDRTIILLPRNAGTYEFGIDGTGGWTAAGGLLHPLAPVAANFATALYASRLGYLKYPSDAAVLKEIGVDPKLGDRVEITPKGGAPMLVLIKPATSLVGALQFGNGQITVFSEYRSVKGVLYPFRVMEGADVTHLTVFAASVVDVSTTPPQTAMVTRPALPIATPSAHP